MTTEVLKPTLLQTLVTTIKHPRAAWTIWRAVREVSKTGARELRIKSDRDVLVVVLPDDFLAIQGLSSPSRTSPPDQPATRDGGERD